MTQPSKIAPSSASTPLDTAVTLHKTGKIREAEAAYRDIITGSPENDAALYRLGILCAQSNRADEAITHLQRAIAINPADPEYSNMLAATYMGKGNQEEAGKTFRDALAAHPTHSNLLTNYGAFLVRTGNPLNAEKQFQEALKANPRNAEAINNLGLIYYNKGDSSHAVPMFKEAVSIKPDYANAWYNLGEGYKALCRYTEASDAFEQVTILTPQKTAGWVNYAIMLTIQNETDKALAIFRKIIETDPREVNSYLQINYLLKSMARFDEIPALIEKARKHLPNASITAIIEAQYLRKKKQYKEARDLLLPFANNTDPFAQKVHYELGQIFEKLDEPARAFHHYTEGNKLALLTIEAQTLDYELAFKNIVSYKAETTREKVKNWTAPVENNNHQTPVFLVGFPRSGTTLLDQILSAHPGIFVSAERESFAPVIKLICGGNKKTLVERLPQLTGGEIESLRTFYFDIHKSYSDWQDREVFIDKLPLNLNLLNLIYRMFPKAKIITALRHPCDCVLSNYMYEFTPNYAMIHTNNIESCARLYTESMDLYEHYKTVLPLPIHEIRYEDVVTDLRTEAQKLLKFLDLPWNEGMMEYYKAANAGKYISTPSAGQVTEKLYTSSSYRWRRYRDQLAPVLPMLEPWAKKFGYEM